MIGIFLSLCSVVFRLNINITKSVIKKTYSLVSLCIPLVCAFQAITVIDRDADSLFPTGKVFDSQSLCFHRP